MPRRGRQPVDTREKILDAAATLFAERGYVGASVNAIAERVGVSAPAIYWHFDSKQEILMTFLRESLGQFNGYLLSAVDSDTRAGGQIRAFATAHVTWQIQHRRVVGLLAGVYGMGTLLSHLDSRDRTEIERLNRVSYEHLHEIVDRGVAADEFTVEQVGPTCLMILVMCEHVVTWFDPDGTLSVEEVARLHGDAALRIVAEQPVQPLPSAALRATDTSA